MTTVDAYRYINFDLCQQFTKADHTEEKLLLGDFLEIYSYDNKKIKYSQGMGYLLRFINNFLKK